MILWTHLFSLGLAHLLEGGVARLPPLILEDDVAKGRDVDAELAGVQVYPLVLPVPGMFSTDLDPRLRGNVGSLVKKNVNASPEWDPNQCRTLHPRPRPVSCCGLGKTSATGSSLPRRGGGRG